jgi:hypothetical protein
VAAALGERGGRDADNISCGMKDKVGEANEVAVDERIDGLRFIEVGEGGGDGFGMDVVILGAGRMSYNLAFCASEGLRSRIAPMGTSM